jgi:hypothetical protein
MGTCKSVKPMLHDWMHTHYGIRTSGLTLFDPLFLAVTGKVLACFTRD